MHQPWMHNQYGRNLRLTCLHHPKALMKGIDCIPMFPVLSMIGYGKVLLLKLVLHFHEQFRQLDKLTPLDEQLPHSVRLTLLQRAAKSVPDLRIMETMEEDMFLTHSSSSHFSLTYENIS